MLSVLFILFLVVFTNQTPQILKDGVTCKFSFYKNNKLKEYNVPLYITAENSNLQLIFSLCGHIPAIFPNDGSCSKTCLYNKQSKSLITGRQTAEKLFEVEGDEENEINLILKDELKCTAERNYEISIQMIKLDRLLKKPSLTVEECKITVEMIKPDYEPPCTSLLSSKELINLKPLKGEKISIPWEGKEFKIALCGNNKDCGLGNAGCVKDAAGTIIFGTTSTQKVKFDMEDKELKVVASYKERNRKVSNMEILLKCNWEIPTFSNAKYIKPSQQGRRYKFEVDSSYGCVKISSNCLIQDKNNGLVYDLEGITNSTGTKVLNATKLMLMNICGDLKEIGRSGNNNCENQHSQICEIDTNIYTNKGSIPSFEITSQHYVKVFLRNGQHCNETLSYSTEIDIKCSSIDKGPVFVKSENCVTQILWETPKGCPKFQSEADGCSVTTHLEGINLSNLYRENDRIHSFATNDKFMFNMCGKLHSNCSSESEVSACYMSNGIEQIIGWNKPKLSYTNGKFQLKYSGVKCKTADKYASLTINLYCSRAEVPTLPKLNKKDSCTFEADIYSLSACLNRDTVDCVYENDAVKYDLTPLISKESNYQVQDENNNNLVYFLNICQSLINENGLIPGNSMIYLLDKSIPRVWERFISLGKIAHPELSNGKLVTNSILGSRCPLGIDYSSGINFECSENNEIPKLLQKKDCRIEFLWRTKYACPIIKPGGKCLLQGDSRIEVPSDTIKFENGGNTYKFSLCTEIYEICKDKSCLKYKLTRKLLLQNSKLSAEFNSTSSSTCKKTSLTVNLTLQCDKTKDEMTIFRIDQNNCHVNLLMKSSLICRNGNVKTRGLNNSTSTLNVEPVVPNLSIPQKDYSDTSTNTRNFKNNNVEQTLTIPINGDKKPKQISNVKNLEINEIESMISKIFPSNQNIKENKVKPKQEIDIFNKGDKKSTQIVDVKNLKVNKIEPLISNISINNKENSATSTSINNNEENELALKQMVNDMGYDIHKENMEHSISISNYQKCDTVKIGTRTFDLKFIESTTITGKNTYTINFNGTSAYCGGRICENATPILHFIENCPKVIYGENHILLNYTVNGECRNADNLAHSARKIGIQLRCNASSKMTVSSETNCSVEFIYYSPQICDHFKSANGSSVLYFSVGVTLVVIASIILGYFLYQKSRRCSYNSVNNSERIYISHSKLL